MEKLPNKFLLPMSLFFAICFVVMLIGLQMNTLWLNRLDTYFISLIQLNINPFKTELFNIITFFGSVTMIGAVSLGVLLFIYIKKKYRLLLFIACSIMVGVGILPQLLKRLIQRDRPSDALIQETGFSFPSGHATSVTFLYSLLATVLCFYLIQYLRYKYIILLAAFLLIILIMISRVYLGVHYPSDVLAGFFLGLCESIFCIYILNKKKYL
ncbi:phosphatase PAP2 family protein [Paenibacillus endoradicis]|uniref:phosphatase PAP2 family protein n=1 Tax=Paenibacillus endoradicis TaxID=2972487 RepID=UPI00215971CB|nr:phosphatase PAP2 family protein [Paenibacillus endoradicis]MCR8655757.1 phosphatase PAP2 family protein [Paenibacillus endoradicis]MCR8658083.1 phosphatase PAP2 family protein [Paenibacillus endoradicis]